MTYKVIVSSGNDYSIRTTQQIQILLPVNLDDLNDVTITGNPDNYVLMYDSALGQWVNKNPDEVLSAAVTDTTPGYEGLPANFENQLDIDLDNKIDLDAGTF
jgi:hypothetical protein